jgi:hypothetical protein
VLGWLAPVAACAWLAFLGLDSGTAMSSPGRGGLLTAMISSNQSYWIYQPGVNEQGQNAPSPSIFKWTNAGNLTSSIGFTPFRKTTD